MKSSLPPPTKAESERLDRFRWIGCVVSNLFLGRNKPNNLAGYDVHHLIDGNRKVSWLATIPLEPWFHRGVIPDGWTAQEMREQFGPSKARNPREFAQRFGSDRDLLEATNALIAAHERERAA